MYRRIAATPVGCLVAIRQATIEDAACRGHETGYNVPANVCTAGAKAGLRNVPLLAFERWRFAAKWAEDEPALAAAALGLQNDNAAAAEAGVDHVNPKKIKQAASNSSITNSSKKAKQQSDPVIPFALLPAAPEPGLVGDLLRAGLAADAATSLALQLASAAAESAAGLLKRCHQLASGKAASCPAVAVSFHKHSLDFTCSGRFVKVGGLGVWRAPIRNLSAKDSLWSDIVQRLHEACCRFAVGIVTQRAHQLLLWSCMCGIASSWCAALPSQHDVECS